MFSAGAIVFLLFIAILFSEQWEVIHGIHDQHEATIARNNAFAAAGVYGFTMLLSIFMYKYRSKREERAKLGLDSAAPAENRVELS